MRAGTRLLPPLWCLWWSASTSTGLAETAEDIVTSLPGLENSTWPFKVYSGFLQVPGPINGYDALQIHYQFHTSQGDPAKDPVVVWHQGGPGGSSILVGLYGEMGAFTFGQQSLHLNRWAWNRVANMLYLESPAGSGGGAGYSTCLKEGQPVACSWDDKTQAEAYAHSLKAFFDAFPEFAAQDLYLTGESYFGQYGPNIASFILNNEPFRSSLNLKGLALGNACWGGNSTCVACNGPSGDQIAVDFFFGKALFSPKLYRSIQAECHFTNTLTTCEDMATGEVPGHDKLSDKCKHLLTEMYRQVGPHNPYDVYDNCENTDNFLRSIGKDMGWMTHSLRAGLASPATRQAFKELNGGYNWDCPGDAESWIKRADVRKALHLDTKEPGLSDFSYKLSGPASVLLYPELIKSLRILIYNGDSDPCVPFNGNEEWIDDLEGRGVLQQASPWTPWFISNKATPAGYAVEYDVPGADTHFGFATVRLAGHMVPQFQPEAALRLLSSFLAGEEVSAATRGASVAVTQQEQEKKLVV